MGFFGNLWNKAKGVLGRVAAGAKKVLPHIGGVLSTVADVTGIPYLKWAKGIYNVGSKIYNTLTGKGSLKDKLKEASSDVVDVLDVIKKRPTVEENVDHIKNRTADFINNNVDSRLAAPVIEKLHLK